MTLIFEKGFSGGCSKTFNHVQIAPYQSKGEDVK